MARFRRIHAALCALLLLSACLAMTGCDRKVIELQQAEIKNFVLPAEGEEIAVFTVKGYGDIRIKLFEDIAPNSVENFKGLISDGYYDGLIVHRVISDVLIQTGDPKGDGTGGEPHGDTPVASEKPDELFHFTGAVGYARASNENVARSQFYIIAGGTQTDESFNSYAMQAQKYFAPNVKEIYKEKGGQASLDENYSLFGQVFAEDIEIVRSISEVKANSASKPVTQVVVEKAKLVEYHAE